MYRTEKKHKKEGRRVIGEHPGAAYAARTNTLNQVPPQTETQRLISVAFFDLMEGKITKQRFDELTGHLLMEPVTLDASR